jgi:hypothetical protein
MPGMSTAAPALAPLPARTSRRPWVGLPTRQLHDGWRAYRLAARLDDGQAGFLAVVIAAKGGQRHLRFQVVEARPLRRGEQEPRLGEILVGGRIVGFGLADTGWRGSIRATVTSLASCDSGTVLAALLDGGQLALRIEGRRFAAGPGNLPALLAGLLQEVGGP